MPIGLGATGVASGKLGPRIEKGIFKQHEHLKGDAYNLYVIMREHYKETDNSKKSS